MQKRSKGKGPFVEPLLLDLFSRRRRGACDSAARASHEMSYGGGYGGYGGGSYGQGSGSPGRPRNVGAFAPQETTRPGSFAADPSSMSRGAYGGGYGQNAGPGSRARPPAWGRSASRTHRGRRTRSSPRAGTSRRQGGFQPAQRRFGDGGYGGVGAGPGLSAPTGRGGDGGYGGLPPRAFERSSAFGTGPGDRGAMQDAAPRRGFADSPLAQALRRSDEAASAASAAARRRRVQPGERHHRRRVASSAAGGRRLGASAFVNPQRELVRRRRRTRRALGRRFRSRSSASRGTTPPRTTARLPPRAARASPAARAAARTRPEPPRHPARVARETEAPRGRRRGGSLCTWALTYPRRIPTPPPPRRRRPTRSRKPRRWRRGGRPWRRRTQL